MQDRLLSEAILLAKKQWSKKAIAEKLNINYERLCRLFVSNGYMYKGNPGNCDPHPIIRCLVVKGHNEVR